MIIAIGADKKTKTTNAIVGKLKKDGHRVLLFGDLKSPNDDWVNIAKDVALAVKNKKDRRKSIHLEGGFVAAPRSR